MERDPDRHIIFKRLDRAEKFARDIDECCVIIASEVFRDRRRLRNLEHAFAGVSFLFVVYMLCDIFGGI